jgi:CDP-alcohol phosphatidyltransferase
LNQATQILHGLVRPFGIIIEIDAAPGQWCRDSRFEEKTRFAYPYAGFGMDMRTSLLKRWNAGLVQPLERPALAWLATRMPHWVTPDRLTLVGIIGAIIVFLGYAWSGSHPALLWIATLGLAINRFGDSLDGTLARLRKIERPRYGYCLYNAIDCFLALPVAIGIGLCGYVRFEPFTAGATATMAKL